MAILHVRNVPDDLYERIQDLASARNRSISAEVIVLLEEALRQEQTRREQEELLADIRRRRLAYNPKNRRFDSVRMLREDRAR